MTDPLLSSRLVRYADLKPCLNAFVDSRTPGSDKKENFTIIGPGVSENPDQHVHVPEAHGFNIGGARQPPGCLNSQHSHDTAEVFIVHSGKWRFTYGVNADDDSVELGVGDTISIPTKMFRGFENIGDSTGFLFAVLGGDDPGKVTWAPSVFNLAEQYGLVLLEGGLLVDVAAGGEIPEGAVAQRPPDAADIAQLKTPPGEKLAACVVHEAEVSPNRDSALMPLVNGQGVVSEAPIITPALTNDGFTPGPIVGWWTHGFNVRRISLAAATGLDAHIRHEEEVVFVQSGKLTITSASDTADTVEMGPGDTLTIPVGSARIWKNNSSEEAVAFVVRGGDSPAAPVAYTA